MPITRKDKHNFIEDIYTYLSILGYVL